MRPPSTMAGFVESRVRMPMRSASRAIRRGFSFIPSSMKSFEGFEATRLLLA